MKNDDKKLKKGANKKKISLLERVMNTPVIEEFKNLHLLLEPHEIPNPYIE